MQADASPAHVWAAELGQPGAELRLSESDSRYVWRVCRARVGESLSLTDGRGGLARARIASVGAVVNVTVESVERATRTRRAEVLCGPPEGERADWLVEKLAELGVSAFQPIHCARAGWKRGEARLARWRRLARAALLQSLGRFEIEIRPLTDLQPALAGADPAARRYLAHPRGAAYGVRPGPEGAELLVVGPAAGLTAAEIDSCRNAGCQPISLGSNRLRTETAALAWAGAWSCRGLPADHVEVAGGKS